MARKKRHDSKVGIPFLRQKDGYASQKHDWQPTTGKAFREQIKGQVAFPPRREPDPWIDSQKNARAAVGFKRGHFVRGHGTSSLPSGSDD